LGAAPLLGAIVAAPAQILNISAAGEANPSTKSYLGYAWNGATATLDGITLGGNTGVSETVVGTHTLAVGGNNFVATVSQGPIPSGTFQSAGQSPVTLSWSLTAGSFLGVAIDHGVSVTAAASGSVQVSPPVDTIYRLYLYTREGGIVLSADTSKPILNAPSSILVLAGLNIVSNKGTIVIRNSGGGILSWNASSQTPGLISIDTPSGQTPSSGAIAFSINTTGKTPGDYPGVIYIDAGEGGSASVAVTVRIFNELKRIFLPLVVNSYAP
jgi:hypothetical protein